MNDTKYCRAVLLLWFWHPDIPKGQRGNTMEDVTGRKGQDRRRKLAPPLLRGFRAVEEREMGDDDDGDGDGGCRFGVEGVLERMGEDTGRSFEVGVCVCDNKRQDI